MIAGARLWFPYSAFDSLPRLGSLVWAHFHGVTRSVFLECVSEANGLFSFCCYIFGCFPRRGIITLHLTLCFCLSNLENQNKKKGETLSSAM